METLKNTKWALTGEFDRSGISQLILSLGGEIVANARLATHLISGRNPGSKILLAQSKGLPIIKI